MTRTYSVPTLERWYYALRIGGLEALRPEPRSDRGAAKALTAEPRTLLLDIRRDHPSISAALILDTLERLGRVEPGAVSANTVRCLFRRHGLSRVSKKHTGPGKGRRRWEAARPGVLWHGDVCHGPVLPLGGETRPLTFTDYSTTTAGTWWGWWPVTPSRRWTC